jgi:hypothetical protein
MHFMRPFGAHLAQFGPGNVVEWASCGSTISLEIFLVAGRGGLSSSNSGLPSNIKSIPRLSYSEITARAISAKPDFTW